MITSWSHSRDTDFTKCRHMAFLKYVKRIPEPERPLKPGQTEHANDRGSRVHDALEMYVSGQSDFFPQEARSFSVELEAMRKLYQAKTVSLEGEWGFNRAWEPTDWKTAWLRMKLDSLVFLSKHEAVAIDYKTGAIFGNEIKHGEQLQLYTLACFLRFPDLEEVHTELWYLDHDRLTRATFSRKRAMSLMNSWDRRGNSITTCVTFPPNPNHHSCKFCPYGDPANGFPNGTGDCQAGRRA